MTKSVANSQYTVRRRALSLYFVLGFFNAGAWIWAFLMFRHYPQLLGTSLLAYTLGLRHAVDADHIAAIDNVTRKLMLTGQRPVTVGLYFSLGHSTIVILASIAVAATATTSHFSLTGLKEAGGLVGTLVSTFFLLAIAAANLLVLRSLTRALKHANRFGQQPDANIESLLSKQGFLSRLLRPTFRLVSTSWHMYPLGFLFGLGFDTATEIGLLGMSAAGAAQGMSIWSILVFPALFTAGMTLIDTSDSILMLYAYTWAYVKPARKLYYNITITSISVMVALIVAGVEGLGLVSDFLHVEGKFWNGVALLNQSFGLIGYAVIGIFLLSWIFSMAVVRIKGSGGRY